MTIDSLQNLFGLKTDELCQMGTEAGVFFLYIICVNRNQCHTEVLGTEGEQVFSALIELFNIFNISKLYISKNCSVALNCQFVRLKNVTVNNE